SCPCDRSRPSPPASCACLVPSLRGLLSTPPRSPPRLDLGLGLGYRRGGRPGATARAGRLRSGGRLGLWALLLLLVHLGQDLGQRPADAPDLPVVGQLTRRHLEAQVE